MVDGERGLQKYLRITLESLVFLSGERDSLKIFFRFLYRL